MKKNCKINFVAKINFLILLKSVFTIRNIQNTFVKKYFCKINLVLIPKSGFTYSSEAAAKITFM